MILKRDVMFPAIFNGRVVGEAKGLRGDAVGFVNIAGAQVTVSLHGANQTIPWQDTNIEEVEVRSGWALPSTGSAAAPAAPAPGT